MPPRKTAEYSFVGEPRQASASTPTTIRLFRRGPLGPRQRAGLFSALFALSLGLLGPACKKESEVDRVKAVVQKAIDAANAKKPGGVVEDALSTFRGPQDADLAECRRIITGYLLSPGWVHVFVRDLSVTVEGEQAKASIDTVLARGNPVEKLEDLVPTNGDALTFEVELRRIDGDWKFERARYRRTTGL
jgi:hypothetical protein